MGTCWAPHRGCLPPHPWEAASGSTVLNSQKLGMSQDLATKGKVLILLGYLQWWCPWLTFFGFFSVEFFNYMLQFFEVRHFNLWFEIFCGFYLEKNTFLIYTSAQIWLFYWASVSKKWVVLQSNTIVQPGEEIPADFSSQYSCVLPG